MNHKVQISLQISHDGEYINGHHRGSPRYAALQDLLFDEFERRKYAVRRLAMQ